MLPREFTPSYRLCRRVEIVCDTLEVRAVPCDKLSVRRTSQ